VYEYLEGRLASRGAARLVLDVGGVGYELSIPVGARFPIGASSPGADGAHLRVWTHLVVREDAHLLYGFPDAGTRDLFRALLTVSGVGPRVALGVLSGLPREELLAAILAGDVARLTAVRGVGKKTAEQILLDLRDKALRLAAAGDGAAERPRSRGEGGAAPNLGASLEDAVGALISIGFSDKDARRQVERAARQVDPRDLELLVRTAIQG
jgi:Holliday junction DNA helicase RuvA